MRKWQKKPLEFLGSALGDLRDFPVVVRQEFGQQLRRVQFGGEPDDWKSMATIGLGVKEIRLSDEGDQYRTIFVAKFETAVFVLHCFQKKTQKTAKADIDLAASRYRALIRELKG